MLDTLPQPPTVSRKARRARYVEAPPGFRAMQHFIARRTGTTYAEGLTTRVPNLDTVCDGETLTNMRGAVELSAETIGRCRGQLAAYVNDPDVIKARNARPNG